MGEPALGCQPSAVDHPVTRSMHRCARLAGLARAMDPWPAGTAGEPEQRDIRDEDDAHG